MRSSSDLHKVICPTGKSVVRTPPVCAYLATLHFLIFFIAATACASFAAASGASCLISPVR